MFKSRLKGCGCTAAFFPKTINQTESPPCSIYDHVTCVKEHLVAFNQSARAQCNCQKDCVHSEPVAIHIQYGHQKPMAGAENATPKNSQFAIASILVQMDSIELTRFEVAEYPFEVSFYLWGVG